MSQKLALGDIFKVTQNRVLILGSETPWLDSRGLRWPTMLFHDTKWRPKQLLQKVLSDLRKVTTQQMLNRRVLINRLKLWSASPQRWLTLPTGVTSAKLKDLHQRKGPCFLPVPSRFFQPSPIFWVQPGRDLCLLLREVPAKKFQLNLHKADWLTRTSVDVKKLECCRSRA